MATYKYFLYKKIEVEKDRYELYHPFIYFKKLEDVYSYLNNNKNSKYILNNNISEINISEPDEKIIYNDVSDILYIKLVQTNDIPTFFMDYNNTFSMGLIVFKKYDEGLEVISYCNHLFINMEINEKIADILIDYVYFYKNTVDYEKLFYENGIIQKSTNNIFHNINNYIKLNINKEEIKNSLLNKNNYISNENKSDEYIILNFDNNLDINLIFQ